MGRLSLPTLSNVRSQSTLNIKLVHRSICNSNFDNGVLNETISEYHFETGQHFGNNLEKEKRVLFNSGEDLHSGKLQNCSSHFYIGVTNYLYFKMEQISRK